MQPPSQRAAVAAGPSGSNPSLSLQDEIKATLAQSIDRRAAVPGRNELPLEDMSAEAVKFHLQLPQQGKVERYQAITGGQPYVATYALPVHLRTGRGTSFMWQRHPFDVPLDNSAKSPRPTEAEVKKHGARSQREGPGVDCLLPYWLAVYVGVLPKP